jgi:carbonic anhydrase
MMSQPITASAAQIAAFKAVYPMNARPLQDENNRLVVLGR